MSLPPASDLVEFARHDLAAHSPWALAGEDHCPVGAPLDRVYGDADASFVAGIAGEAELSATASDPLVVLQTLADGLMLPPADAAGTGASAGFAAEPPIAVVPDAAWETIDIDWSYDGLA